MAVRGATGGWGVANKTDWLERAAVGASALCLAHRLALPILVTLTPALSSALDLPERVHLWLLAAAVQMKQALALSEAGRARGKIVLSMAA